MEGISGHVATESTPAKRRELAANVSPVQVSGALERCTPPAEEGPMSCLAFTLGWLVALHAGEPTAAAPQPASGPKAFDFEAARRHWAYQPIRRPMLPEVRDRSWAVNPIDRFVLARLEAAGLTPSPPADRRTLLRRVSYDLIGLPPTYADVEAFVRDDSPDAFAKVVDRLLASPHYGERWGRHWLDVARYADTKDLVLLFGADRIRPYAYTYRDYVIRALNADTPYDRFVHEQLAADQLLGVGHVSKVPPSRHVGNVPHESWRLAALGFLTLGRLFCNNPHDVYDDQIDTVTRGLLGLTVACARCHDHKYDAIPTADYYSLYGVFAGSEEPIDLPLIGEPPPTAAAAEFEKQLAQKRQQLQQHMDAQYQQITDTARARVTDYLLRIATEKPDPLEDAVYYLSLSPDDLKPQIVSRWRRYLEKHARADDPVFGPWNDLMRLADDRFAEAARDVVARWRSVAALNPLVREALDTPLTGKADIARLYGGLLKRVYDESRKSPGAQPKEAGPLLALLTSEDGPVYFPKRSTYLYMARVERETYNRLLREMDKLAATSAGAPPRAMVLVDSPQPGSPRVFVRGNPAQPGESVPRQFLRILAGDARQPFTHGSGRLDLAKAITAADNPLTARVIVNRVWMHHFGEPLVATPSDFGTRSSPPSHPELLDYLAATLQHDGWSLKQLHRRIVLSSTYQQASRDRPECRQRDPDNRLLWRFNRRRLDLEAMRDTLLAVSARLDRTLGGRPVDVAGDPLNRRRTVYGLVDRQSLPGLFRAFDFAVPDQSVERRPQTTVPQQALFAMNAPFLLEQARALAARPEVAGETTPEGHVAALYRLVLARQPRPAEVKLALAFVAAAEAEPAPTKDAGLTPWQQYAQVLLMTNEALFVD
jgi:hypothetical protein